MVDRNIYISHTELATFGKSLDSMSLLEIGITQWPEMSNWYLDIPLLVWEYIWRFCWTKCSRLNHFSCMERLLMTSFLGGEFVVQSLLCWTQTYQPKRIFGRMAGSKLFVVYRPNCVMVFSQPWPSLVWVIVWGVGLVDAVTWTSWVMFATRIMGRKDN